MKFANSDTGKDDVELWEIMRPQSSLAPLCLWVTPRALSLQEWHC